MRDLTAEELKYASRDILVDRVRALQVERAVRRNNLDAVASWAAEQYRRCIVSARATTSGDHYAKCNGRAEAYRQLGNQLADAAGIEAPNWEAIKEAVPPDGIYR